MVTLQFVPYTEIEHLSSNDRIKKLLSIAKEDKIVLLQGRLKKVEESELIKTTMEHINEEFKGIEMSVIYPKNKRGNVAYMLRNNFMSFLLGDRQGMTILGPASVVKEIKQNPDKIELYTKNNLKRKNGNLNNKKKK